MNYGSYMVSSSKMMSTFKLADGPCGGNCYVTAMEATIRYPDGKEANIDTGSWLHHIAMFGTGGGGGSLWAAGNERPTLRLNSEEKYGLNFPSKYMLMIDLMTEAVDTKNLTLEVTFETIPKSNKEYKAATMYWLTIGEPWAKEGKYKFDTILPTRSGVEGTLLYTIGHMHDGGTDMQLYVNNQMVCKSIMHYTDRGSGAAGGKNMAGMQHGHSATTGLHIANPGACTDFGKVKKGDTLRAEVIRSISNFSLLLIQT